jgi:hypothetical protein
MTAVQFHSATEDILKNYWRIKAANALYRSAPNTMAGRLEYSGIPSVGIVSSHFASESVADAMLALHAFIQRRLPRDLFLALIAEFEGRIGARLVSLSASSKGTLGKLQTRIQTKITLPLALIEEFDEIRERRNVMIHHGDIANSQYVTTATIVFSRPNPFVKPVVVGDNVSPTEDYLAYAADVLVRYSNSIG